MPLPWSSTVSRKALPTCTVSLAHAPGCAAQPPYRSLIPFPTLPPTVTSPRPLPLPPHALLRTRMTTEFDFATKRARKSSLSPLSPKPKVATPTAPSMQRRRSRDPNVADRLVVELDDDDHTHSVHPRPRSPGPHSKSTSPDPPAYSTLPPPYSATTDEKKDAPFTLVVEKEEPEDPPPKPSPQPSTSSPSSSSSHKRTRISTSELRVLVYLYRTVVYGLEMRNRKEKDSDLSLSSDVPRSTTTTKKKPLGPRSSPRPISSSSSSPLPEEKSHFESALAAASAKTSRHGFAHFPLVEDDLDSPKGHSTPRTPFHSPSQSPRSSPPPFLRPSPSLDAVASHFAAAPKLKKEKTRAEINAELHVQDALLALRLKEFLRAQGVCEEDLRVDFDDEGRVVEPKEEKVVVVDEPKKETVVIQEEADEENNILDEYFMGIEEEEPAKKNTERGPVVEDDDVLPQPKLDSPFVEEDDLDMDMGDSSPPVAPTPAPPSPPPLRVSTLAQRISSPPPASPSPRPHAVLPTSYMVALLTMRVRHPSKKPGSSSSNSNSGGNGNGNASTSSGNGNGEKGKENKSKVKRKSGLSVVVEVD